MDLKIKSTYPDFAKLLLRLSVGWVFAYHGAQKLFGAFGGHGIEGFAGHLTKLGVPMPGFQAYLAGGTEFFCGLALIFGVLARWAALPLIVVMLVATGLVHWENGFNIANKGYEYNFVLICALTAIFAQGSGKWRIKE